MELASAAIEPAESDDAIEFCYAQGWTDGLPVVPPTVERVRRALEAVDRPPDEILVEYPDRSRVINVEKVAINAVMAGCRPEYLPVVLALVEAMADPGFSLHAANASTGGMALGFVVNGPVRNRLGMNFRGNVLGPGNRANATIGRALRLTQMNAMGSVPGAGHDLVAGETLRPILDRSTVGMPAKYTGYHIPEFEEAFPTLLPLHVLHGFRPEQDVVTLFTAVSHIQISAHGERTASEIIDTVCHYLVGSGRLRPAGSVFVLIPPENAEILVRDGYTKADIAEAIFAGTKRTAAWVKRSGGAVGGGLMTRRGAPVTPEDERTELAIAGSPDDVHVVIAGGPAGGFIYAILPYTGGLAMNEITQSSGREVTR